MNNFDAYREPLQLRFRQTQDRSIPSFSIGYVDGYTKGLAGQLIVAILYEMATGPHILQ